jgi:hypothetical protein
MIGRGNVFINELPFPISLYKQSGGSDPNPNMVGAYLTNYLTKAIANTTNGILPVIGAASSTKLLVGTAPLAKTPTYTTVILDLYTPDAESIASGKAANLAKYPNGFVLSKKWLGHFVVDGPNDLDPAPGAFKFDVSSLGLKGGDPVTATATYLKTNSTASSPIGLTGPFADVVALTAPAEDTVMLPPTLSGNSLTLSWTGGTPPFQVVTRQNVSSGAWGPAGSPTTERTATVTVSGTAFYRVSGQP